MVKLVSCSPLRQVFPCRHQQQLESLGKCQQEHARNPTNTSIRASERYAFI